MKNMHIAICVPGLPFDGNTIKEASLGGSETAGLCLAREFAAKGHDVLMFTNTDRPGKYDGVTYRNLIEFGEYKRMSPHDVTIIQRAPLEFNFATASKLNVLWCHDLALARTSSQLRGTLWNIDKLVVLSKFMHEQYKKTYDLRDEDLFLSRNGLDLNLFENLDLLDRDPHKIMYASRPERGLDIFLANIFPRLLEADPEYRLHLCGYDNKVPERQDFYGMIDEHVRQFGDRIVWLGYLPKDELYQHYATAGCLAYPTPGETEKSFREIYCISAAEAQAAGCPVVTSANGALPETVAKNAGTLIKGDSWTDEYAERFVKAVLATRDPETSKKMSEAGRKATKKLSWSLIADEWLGAFEEWIDGYNSKPERLARWFYKRSDIEAARKVLAKNPCPSLEREINKHYGWFKDEASVQKHYRETVGPYYDGKFVEKVEKGGLEQFDGLFVESREKRFHFFAEFIKRHPEIQNVVDYGCGHGWCDIWLHNTLGVNVTGIDVDPAAIKWSKHFAERKAKEPAMLDFIEGDHVSAMASSAGSGLYDLLICSETLEHVYDPAAVIDAMEQWVKPDGWVILTVPYGPMELRDYKQLPFRNHVREFDHHDLKEMLGDKKVECWTIFQRFCEITCQPCGYYIVTYQPNGAACKEIDWDRKLNWQRPTQTVSACLMAGGDKVKNTAHWCLDSLADIADEIIIADCGMSEEGKRIFDQYPVRYVPSVDPRIEGFEVPRNHSIETATQDWILWIDTDERLIDSQNMFKYLRENYFDNYGIQQHHFSVDAGFPPDMPSRFFRNRKINGKQPRFFGAIHEHPEIGLNDGLGNNIILADVNIAHVGYLSESVRRLRFQRNLPLVELDKQRHPDRLLQKYFVMRDNSLLIMYEGQQNGGAITENIRELARQTRDLYRQYFLGKSCMLNVDPLTFYSQALQILDEGIDVHFDVAAQRNGIGGQLNGGMKARFANVEEAQIEIGHRISQQFSPLTHEWW